ncbi:Dicer-like protein 2 [Cladophialophora chaetospira]|uniref:Dicer-like protein 2 n=1 Tax=Cladophialophora chaetospira TaxID=386627 RepID=A0AA38X5H9_9EURO|nr:Dicer-like protein 2 [Cladophialophora chaetospira]
MDRAPKDTVVSRSYQLEMLDECIKQNTIVVMGTGSGKTHVAILRIKYEIERGPAGKIIWFLAPKVALCRQQYQTIINDIPAVSSILVVGEDNVDHWKDAHLWDAVFAHKIIVSTPAILRDALNRGFLTLEAISLLIFDEAHYCQGGSEEKQIMKDHYFRRTDRLRPRIVGLTASPIMRSNVNIAHLKILESNLDAVCRTPRIQRSELLRHVHLPHFVTLEYSDESIYDGAEVHVLPAPCLDDPISPGTETHGLTTLDLRLGGNNKTLAQIEKQVKAFSQTYNHIRFQLGTWACQDYIDQVRSRLLKAVDRHREMIFHGEEMHNTFYLRAIDSIASRADLHTHGHTAKVARMVAYLVGRANRPFTAIIFVEQRATAILLSRLLHKLLLGHGLSTASFVGTSNCSARPSLLKDITNFGAQKDVLQDFRNGKVRLLVATNVLEEGIDISACNLVISFDPPHNVKSFIQRRGRARDRESEFVMLVANGESNSKLDEWRRGEQLMLEVARAERDHCEQLQRLEADHQEHQTQRFAVPRTGALLTPDKAPNYLQHFCSRLPRDAFTDNLPTYCYEEDGAGMIQALVVLPGAVDTSVREHRSSSAWRTEKAARRDAAYQAYLELYRSGLVDDHLLPVPQLDTEAKGEIPDLPNRLRIPPLHDVWQDEARLRKTRPSSPFTLLSFQIKRGVRPSLELIVMMATPITAHIPSCLIHWTEDELWCGSFSFLEQEKHLEDDSAIRIQNSTNILYNGCRSQQGVSPRADAILFLAPSLDDGQLENWIEENSGCVPAPVAQMRGPPYGLVRTRLYPHRMHVVVNWQDDGNVVIAPIPRRRNFLHPPPVAAPPKSSNGSQTPRKRKYEHELVVPMLDATLDNLNSDAVCLSILLPSMVHHISTTLVAWHFSQQVLPSINPCNMELLVEALSAPCAGESVNYQRLEFIGDSVLKFLVSVQLFLAHPHWHEGYLTLVRKSWVCNKTLAHVACERGLSAYVITTPFSPRRWKSMYLADLDDRTDTSERVVSMKLLADVVEAVIGATFVEGGVHRAAECTTVFLPQMEKSIFGGPLDLPSSYSQELEMGAEGRPIFGELAALIQYQFRFPRLLQEAISHPSCLRLTAGSSYQRLEFVGDAVLDLLVVRALVPHKHLSHVRMHLIKSTLVNAYSLGYWCMKLVVGQNRQEVGLDETNGEFVVKTTIRKISLCHFLQFDNAKMVEIRLACEKRLDSVAEAIDLALIAGLTYPWAQMAYVGTPKFASDLVESILGAIYLDSGGDLESCWNFLGILGMTGYFERLVAEDIELRHPKNILASRTAGKVRYHLKRVKEEEGGLQCYAKVGDMRFPPVSEGISRDDITTRAAEAALKELDAGSKTP